MQSVQWDNKEAWGFCWMTQVAWPHLCKDSEQQRADLQAGIICLKQGNICKLSVMLSKFELWAKLHTFSLSICGSGGGTTIWLAGCVGTGAVRGAAGAGAGGSVSRASLGGRSMMGASRIGWSRKEGSRPL